MIEQLYILLILGLNWATDFEYKVFGVVIGILIIKKTYGLLQGKRIKFSTRWYDLIPLMFVIAWGYGVCVGLANGNDKEFIFRNFAGMVVYLSYYVLLFSRVSKEKIFKITCVAACVVLISTIILQILTIASIVDNSIVTDIFGTVKGGSSTGQSRLFFVGQLTIFVLVSLIMVRILDPARYRASFNTDALCSSHFQFRSLLWSVVVLVVALYAVIIIPASKGYVLALIVLLVVLVTIFYLPKVFSGRFKITHIFFSLLVAVGIYIMITTGYATIAQVIFDSEDISNAARYEQFYYIMDDMTLLGNGLGAVLPGSYSRSSEFAYGFELTYVNLFHKLGIVAIPLFLIYIYMFIIIIKGFNRKDTKIIYPAASLGAMIYLFPSIGNPMLFAPQLVLLHCIALLLMRK